MATTFPLDDVILGAKLEAAYAWSRSELFSRGLLVCACSKPVVVTQGQTVPCPEETEIFEKDKNFKKELFENLLVLECRPLLKGHIGLKTKITILEYECCNRKDTQVTSEHPYSYPHIVNSFIGSHKTDSIGSILTCGLLPTSNCIRETKLCVCYDLNLFKELCTKYDENRDCDIFHSVCVSERFASSTGIIDKCYIELSMKEDSGEVQTSLFIVKVVKDFVQLQQHCSHSKCDSGMFSLPSVIHALRAETPLISSQITTTFKLLQHSSSPGLSSIFSDSPDHATQLHIRCIRSPMYNCAANFGVLLEKYFRISRIVKKDEILTIPTEDCPELWHDLNDSTEGHAAVVYFKVCYIQSDHSHPKIAVASKYFTKLIQESTLEAYAPTVMQFVSSFGCYPVPPGLGSHHCSVRALLHPYVQHASHGTAISGADGISCPHTLVSGPSGCGLTGLVKSVAMSLNLHCIKVMCELLLADSAGATEAKLQQAVQVARSHAPCVLLLEHIHLLAKDRDGTTEDPRVATAFCSMLQTLCKSTKDLPVVIVATTSSPKQVHPVILETFLYHHKVQALNEQQRTETLDQLLDRHSLHLSTDVGLKNIEQKTAGMVLADLSSLVTQVQRIAFQRIVDWCKSSTSVHNLSWEMEESLSSAGYSLCQEDFDKALEELQNSQVDQLATAKIPEVRWSDIGGLEHVKRDILDTIQLPLQQPELFSAGLRRSGVLLYGPPGTGKTLCAKAVATECSLNFLSVKGPELINMYVGQSEENIREVFQRARDASPCVIFFDELDSLAPNRGRSGDSGGVMDRVVSQLLAELDGVTKSNSVFVIGATNRPDLLDPALLRPGRFDKLIFIGVSQTTEQRLNILKTLTKRFVFAPGCDLEEIVNHCPANMTGADFYALCSDAMLSAIKMKVDLLEEGEDVDQTSVEVSRDDFMKSLDKLSPSVSVTELQRYSSVHKQFTV